jgi:hypothetical protein
MPSNVPSSRRHGRRKRCVWSTSSSHPAGRADSAFGVSADGCTLGEKEGRMFFFEKKNQKTFAFFGAR